MQKYTFRDFDRDFPTDDACLDWLRDYLYPDGIYCKVCGKVTKHHRVKSRPSYSCDRCGHHEHPMAGTIFENSRTPLKIWFHAIYLMASTRCGISAKQLERETGVTYKTAWRMFKQIRLLLEEELPSATNPVEADETYIGGSRRGTKRGRPGADSHKTPVFGMAERNGGVKAVAVSDVKKNTLLPHIAAHVPAAHTIYTDELKSYNGLVAMGYAHGRVNHSAGVYADGIAHVNTIEGFWSLLKRGITGVYHSVGREYLQSYLNEYAFRYSHRNDEQPMFVTMLAQVQKASSAC